MIIYRLTVISEYYTDYVEQFTVCANSESEARELCNLAEYNTLEGLDYVYSWINPKYAICEVIELDRPKVISDAMHVEKDY